MRWVFLSRILLYLHLLEHTCLTHPTWTRSRIPKACAGPAQFALYLAPCTNCPRPFQKRLERHCGCIADCCCELRHAKNQSGRYSTQEKTGSSCGVLRFLESRLLKNKLLRQSSPVPVDLSCTIHCWDPH